MKGIQVTLSMLLALAAATGIAASHDGPVMSDGQLLYVAAYSNVYYGARQRTFQLACLLSIRNVDPEQRITVSRVDYFDSAGKLVRTYLERPVALAPLATLEYYVPEHDSAGGAGANFLVRWSAGSQVNAPVVETLMIGVEAAQGLSFVSSAREITEAGR